MFWILMKIYLLVSITQLVIFWFIKLFFVKILWKSNKNQFLYIDNLHIKFQFNKIICRSLLGFLSKITRIYKVHKYTEKKNQMTWTNISQVIDRTLIFFSLKKYIFHCFYYSILIHVFLRAIARVNARNIIKNMKKVQNRTQSQFRHQWHVFFYIRRYFHTQTYSFVLVFHSKHTPLYVCVFFFDWHITKR